MNIEKYLKLKKIKLNNIYKNINKLKIGDMFLIDSMADSPKKGDNISYLEVINIKKNSVEYIIKTEKLK